MANATIEVQSARPIAKASFAAYSANAVCGGKRTRAVIVDMAALRVTDVGSAARIEFSTRRASYVANVDADHVALFGDAGIAVAQWACKALREAIRTDREINPERIPADDYIEHLRGTMASAAPDALRLIPHADGQRRSRRVKKTAVAEGQLSLLDGLAAEPIQQSLFETVSTPSGEQRSLFDNLPNLTDNDNWEVISNITSSTMVEEVEDGDVRNRPSVPGSSSAQVQAAHGNQSGVGGGASERRAGRVPGNAGTPVPEQVQRPRDLDGGEEARREPADRRHGGALRPDRDVPGDSSRDSAAGAARRVASDSGAAASWDKVGAIDSQAAASPLERAQDNVAALSVLLTLRTEGRSPTADELRMLGSYSGWGGAANAFKDEYREDEADWAKVNQDLRDLLSEDEYANARSSTLTAFYTPSSVARSMHDALSSLGFGAEKKSSSKADRVLEPGCGTGNFMGVGDADGRGYVYDGIEVDPVSAQIASYLHPEDHIVNASIDDCYISRDSYDAVVGNVPYSDAIKMDFGGRSVPIHDYFIMQSIECLRPGGVAALLTSRYTMDKRGEATREWIAQRADLIGFVRLPEETFRAQAGTEAVSDVLLFRKRAELIEQPDRAWIHTATLDAPDGSSIPVNAMLLDFPGEHIVGESRVVLGQHGYTLDVTSGLTDKQIGEKLGEMLSAQVRNLGDIHTDLQKRLENPCAAVKPKAAETLYEFFVENGQIWYGDGEIVEAVSLNRQDNARMSAMVSFRDSMRELMAFERLSADEDAVAERISELDAEYDAFVESFGRLSDAKNRKLWSRCGTDYSLATLQAAEVKDASGAFLRKGDILSKRVQSPVEAAPDHMDDVHDALTFSLDRTGRVDLDLIKSITGLDEEDVVDALGGAVIRDPESGNVVLADEYLSGDVLSKIDFVDGLISGMTTDAAERRLSEWYAESGIASAVDGINDYADFAFKKMMNKHNGSWGAFVDPLHSAVGVDVDASLDAVTGGNYYKNGFSLGSTLVLASELRRGCVLMKGPGDPCEIWEAAARSLHQASRASEYPVAIHLLRQFASMPADVVSDEALAMLLAYSGLIDDRVTRPIFENLLKADIGPDRYFHRLTYDKDPEYREDALAALDAIVKELRSDRDILDYALLASVEAARSTDAYHHYFYAYRIPVSANDLYEYKAAREAFEKAHPIDIDAAKLDELRKTRARLEEAAPKRLEPSEIAVNLGSPWIPPSVYYEFASEVFNFAEARRLSVSRRSSASNWSVSRSHATGAWQIRYGGAPELSPSVVAAYGTQSSRR